MYILYLYMFYLLTIKGFNFLNKFNYIHYNNTQILLLESKQAG